MSSGAVTRTQDPGPSTSPGGWTTGVLRAVLSTLLGRKRQRQGATSEDIRERWTVQMRSLRLPEPARGVLPADAPRMASDSQINGLYGTDYGCWSGYGFMGYSLLSELAQIAEYRKPAEILANEMTRKWGKVVSKSEDKVKDRVDICNKILESIGAQEAFRRAYELDDFFGHGKIFMDIGGNPEDLINPLVLKLKIRPGTKLKLKCIEPIWIYPNAYNAMDPINEYFFKPQTWYVLGRLIHSTRFLTFVSRPVPDLLKPAYMFGGLSLTQILQPYVENWLRTRQSVSDITHNYSTPVLKGDMGQVLQPGSTEQLVTRLEIFNVARDNQGVMFLDKEKEDFVYATASLGSLDKLQAQAQEQMAAISQIPLIKLFGIEPSGLNASSEGSIKTFYDTITSRQERVGTPNMDRLLEVVQMAEFGDIDEDIAWLWNPLEALDERSLAEVRKIQAETDCAYVDHQILDPMEVRAALVGEEDSRYADVDPDEQPESPEQAEGEATPAQPISGQPGQATLAQPGQVKPGEKSESVTLPKMRGATLPHSGERTEAA